MGRGKEMWMDEMEKTADLYPGEWTRAQAVDHLKRLGLDPIEIDDHLSALDGGD